MSPRLLTVMGSGETAPTMAKVHRSLVERVGQPAVVLDTPFGFQANADDLTARTVTYFRESVGVPLGVASFRRSDAEPVALATALARLREARYVFAGPGSPSYALRQWAGTAVPTVLADALATGGAVTFASAAALTLGILTVPVYEIYKSGEDPRWLDGLDLLGAATGLRAAVIPHYDNAEGGTHDTRFCYLGEGRLALLERSLPDGAFVLGVDEHTGLVLDLDAGTAEVVGRGVVTVRSDGRSTEVPSGSAVAIAELATLGTASAATAPAPVAAVAPAPSLVEEVRTLDAGFDAAVAGGDATAAVAAVLGLDDAVHAWSSDPLQSDAADRARTALRAMVVRLGELAVSGLADPATVVGPFVDALLAVREGARDRREWVLADDVRDRLVEAGIEVHDAPEGTTWTLAG